MNNSKSIHIGNCSPLSQDQLIHETHVKEETHKYIFLIIYKTYHRKITKTDKNARYWGKSLNTPRKFISYDFDLYKLRSFIRQKQTVVVLPSSQIIFFYQ